MSEQGAIARGSLPGMRDLVNSMTQPNEQLIETIEKALEAATPGKWWHYKGTDSVVVDGDHFPGKRKTIAHALRETEDAHLLANAPEWLRALLEELEDWKLEIDSANSTNRKLIDQLQQTREELREVSELQSIAANNCEKLQSELEQVKEERDSLRLALEDVADYQHRWSDSPIREVQKIARTILSKYEVKK